MQAFYSMSKCPVTFHYIWRCSDQHCFKCFCHTAASLKCIFIKKWKPLICCQILQRIKPNHTDWLSRTSTARSKRTNSKCLFFLGTFLSFPVNITCLIAPVVYGAHVYCSLGFCAKTHTSEKLKCLLRSFSFFFYTSMKLLPLTVNRTC